MPDAERLIDTVRVNMSRTSEQVAYAKGFIDGKSHARKEVAKAALLLTCFAVAIAVSIAA